MKLAEKCANARIFLALCLGFVLSGCPLPNNSGNNGDPVLTGTVNVTGTLQVGQTLTADTFALDGSGSISYRWHRNDNSISGTDGRTYTLVEADRGAYIKVEVRRDGYNGSVFSSPRGPVAGRDDPALTGTVSIDGILQVGQTLTANTSAVGGTGNLGYRWHRDELPINGATGSSYTLVQADKDSFIKVEVSRNGYAGSVFSNSRGPVAGTGEVPSEVIYGREYWGEWIRMDTGETYYFSDKNLTINGQIRSFSGTLAKESARVIDVNESGRRYLLYASRPATARFTGKVVDMRDAGQSREVRSIGGFEAMLVNLKNEADKHTVSPNSEGRFEVPNSIAEDEYQITFPEAPEIPAIVVSAGYSGDDIGTVNLTEGANFKISVRAANSQNTDMTRLFADFTPYNLVIDILNTGTESFTAANFDLNFGDLVYSPAVYDKMLGTILPGARKNLSFTISNSPFSEIQSYKNKNIGITINDPINRKTWEDSVQLQFHKTPVNFNIRSNNAVQGVIITPQQKAYHFKTASASGYSATVTLPWTSEPYLVVFSGATVDTESKYSLGINVMPDTDFLTFANGAAHEPNNTEAQAYSMDIRTMPKIMSYLHVNDIDYFRVSLGSTPPVTLPVSMVDRELREVNTSANTVKVGESTWLDIRFRNNSTRTINPSLALSTNSGYVTVVDGNRSLGQVSTQNYKTLTSNQTDQAENARFYNGGSSTSNAFRFRVEDNCPDNEQINFTLTYTEGTATWQESFTITAQPRDRSVAIATPAADNRVLEENGGNADGRVSPGENAYLRITAMNTGADATASLRAELRGFNTGHFTANTPSVSAISAGGFSVITFNLSVNAACPTGLIGPLTLTLTETSGRQRKWTDTVPAVTIYLKPPAGLNVEPDGQSRARVSWTADSNARSYKVYHSTDSGGPSTNIGTVTHPTVSYAHSGVAGGTNNYYRVSAVDANDIESAQSAAVTYSPLGIYGNVNVTEQNGNWDGRINPGETALLAITVRNPGTTAVTGLQASLSGFDSTITVTENIQNIGTLNGNSSTTVYFTLNVNADCPTGPVGPLTMTFTESGGQYRTWVDTVPAFDITIATPSNVRASADAYGSITVSWNAVSGDNVSYKVYVSEDYWGTYSLLNTTKVTGTSYTHSGLGEGQTRYYKVSAVDSGNREGLQFSGAPLATSWYTLPAFNDLHDGGSMSNGTIYYYRFPAINGTQYKVSWTGSIRVSAFRADGEGSAWFSNSTSSGQERTSDITGYMAVKIEGTGGGNYSLQIDSGTQALNSFGFNFPLEGLVNGTINHIANTIDVIVPFQTSLLSLTPVVTYPATGDVYCTGYTPSGAQNFTNPRKYVFNWSDGSKHTYTVNVSAKGQGDITIILPGMIEDESVGGFAGNITVSKTSAGYSSTHQIQVAAGYASYEWYVDGAGKTADSGSEDRYFTIRAADYAIGRHTITIIVYKDGRPYSNGQSFTVAQ